MILRELKYCKHKTIGLCEAKESNFYGLILYLWYIFLMQQKGYI